VFGTGLHWSEYSTLYLDLERILNVAMPRKPTSEHSYEDRKLRSPMKYRSTRRGVFSYEGELKPFVFHRLPRLDSDDGLSAARKLVGGETEWFYLPTVQSLIEVLQKQPVVIELNWYEDFNHPMKHPFLKAQRQFFFIGENISLGKLLGSHALVACGYHKARTGASWIRFQNCWGHDYPLVWMPIGTVKGLFGTGEMDASIPA
jgi:hypothetical protein